MREFFLSIAVVLGVFLSNIPDARGDSAIESYGQLPLLSSPKLSPSGKKYGGLVSLNGEQKFLISYLNAKDGPRRLINLRQYDLTSWSWVNDDWLVATFAANQKLFGDNWNVTRTISIKADGSKVINLKGRDAGQHASDILWIAKDGSPHIILSYQTSIYSSEPGFWRQVDLIDVSTGKTKKKLVKSKVGVQSWYADANGQVRMGIARFNKSLKTLLYYRERNGKQFRVRDRAKQKRNESITAPSVFLEDPTKALVFDDKDGRDALYTFDLTNFTIGEKMAAPENYDIAGIRTNGAGNKLTGFTWIDTAYRIKWLDKDIDHLATQLQNAVPDQSVSLVSNNRAQDRFLVHIGTASSPGAYYVYDHAWGKMLKLANVRDKFKAKAYAPVKTIRYKARDGLEIEGVLTLPKDREAKNLPFIVLPHGGPFARDYERWDWEVQFLANRGYAVLQPNYRGSSGYGKEFAKRGEGEWGRAMQDDVDDGVKWAVDQGIADKQRVCIMGGSYGGYAAMWGAYRNPEIYKCAISFAGVSNLPSMLRYNKRFLNSKFGQTWLEEQIDDFKAVSPIYFAKDINVPLLLIHGKLDQRVEVKQSRTIAKKMQRLGKNIRYIEQPKGDHHFTREEDRIQYLTEVDNFLKQHNPADAPPVKKESVAAKKGASDALDASGG